MPIPSSSIHNAFVSTAGEHTGVSCQENEPCVGGIPWPGPWQKPYCDIQKTRTLFSKTAAIPDAQTDADNKLSDKIGQFLVSLADYTTHGTRKLVVVQLYMRMTAAILWGV